MTPLQASKTRKSIDWEGIRRDLDPVHRGSLATRHHAKSTAAVSSTSKQNNTPRYAQPDRFSRLGILTPTRRLSVCAPSFSHRHHNAFAAPNGRDDLLLPIGHHSPGNILHALGSRDRADPVFVHDVRVSAAPAANGEKPTHREPPRGVTTWDVCRSVGYPQASHRWWRA